MGRKKALFSHREVFLVDVFLNPLPKVEETHPFLKQFFWEKKIYL